MTTGALSVQLSGGGPVVTRRGHVVRWWTGSAPTSDVGLAFASLMPRLVAEEPAWGPIAEGPFTPEELDGRTIVRAMAAAAMPWRCRRQGQQLEPERLEGIRVPWRIFRAAYDHAAANPVYGGSPYKRERWSEQWYPGPRKPGVAYRWTGAWNPRWRWGYEFWGCHVWTIEWLRDPSLPRQVDVIVDAQTD